MSNGEIDIAYNEFKNENSGSFESLDFLIFCSEKKKLKKPILSEDWKPSIEIKDIPSEIINDYYPLFMKTYSGEYIQPDINKMFLNYCWDLWGLDCRNSKTKKATMMWLGWQPKKETKEVLTRSMTVEDMNFFIAEFSIFHRDSKTLCKNWDLKILKSSTLRKV